MSSMSYLQHDAIFDTDHDFDYGKDHKSSKHTNKCRFEKLFVRETYQKSEIHRNG